MIQRSAEFFQRVAGAIAGKRAEIAFRDTAGKVLEALDACGEAEGNQQRSSSCEQQNNEGREPQAAAEGAEKLLNGGERNGETQHDRRTGADVLLHGVIKQVAIDGDTVARGLPFALGERVTDFGPAGVIFHGAGIGLRIRENQTNWGDDSNARTAGGHFRGPFLQTADFFGISRRDGREARRARLRNVRDGSQLRKGGVGVILAEGALGEEIQGEQHAHEQGEKRQR